MENVSVCVNKFFHFALKRYFISKTVTCFWSTCRRQRTALAAGNVILLSDFVTEM
jgi:hypothetical protein